MKGQAASDRASTLAFLPDLLKKGKADFTPLRPLGLRSVNRGASTSVARPSPSVLLFLFARRWGVQITIEK